MHVYAAAGFVLCFGLAGCAGMVVAPANCVPPASGQYVATTLQSGVIQCGDAQAGSCELSAVAWVQGAQGGSLVFGNDKAPVSGQGSSVFSMPYDGAAFDPAGMKTPYAFPPFSRVSKFEAMAVSPDGGHVIAMNAFDRFDPDHNSMDRYNMLLAWPANLPAQAQVLAQTERGGAASSVLLRTSFAQALQHHSGADAVYFKLEGVALMPQGRIVFGVRELGRSHTDFEYRAILLAGGYRVTAGRLEMDPTVALSVLRDFSGPGGVSARAGRTVGLSSLEYDAAGKRLLMLTSYESADAVGAYVWVLPDQPDGSIGIVPHLVRNDSGAPFLFTHKAEGLAVIGGGRVFVIHDDDRIATPMTDTATGGFRHERRVNEAAFDILHLGVAAHPQGVCH